MNLRLLIKKKKKAHYVLAPKIFHINFLSLTDAKIYTTIREPLKQVTLFTNLFYIEPVIGKQSFF
jgi:hypothetical protein